MDLDELNSLLSAFHAVINIPGTQNIQRELLKQIREIDRAIDAKPEPVPGPKSLPLGADGSEAQDTSSPSWNSPQQGVRRI